MDHYYDLHVRLDDDPADLEGMIKLAEHIGWGAICITTDFRNIRGLSTRINDTRKKTAMNLLSGARITAGSINELQKTSRDVLSHADLILVEGVNEETCRAAAECWEVDIVCHPEKLTDRDPMRQKNSGVDHVMAKMMSERLIAMEFNFSELLNSYGMLRSQILGRMRQNVMLARKYNTPMILTSGAHSMWELRSPGELTAIGKAIGMTQQEAKTAVSENPSILIRKSRDRKNPSILLKGLEVVEWGNQKPQKKRMYGWY
jgi:ribonuclease P/MRP protein subunit RPP1